MVGTQISFFDSEVDALEVEKISKKEVDKKKNGNNPFVMGIRAQILERLRVRFDKHCRRYGEDAEDVMNTTIAIFMEKYDITRHKTDYDAYKFLWGTAHNQFMRMTLGSKNAIPVKDEEFENAKWDEMHKYHITKKGKVYKWRHTGSKIEMEGAVALDTTDPLAYMERMEILEKIKMLPVALKEKVEVYFEEGIEPRKEVMKKIVAELRKIYGLEAQTELCLN